MLLIFADDHLRYDLFENYQRTVHHERPGDISRKGFQRFLCSGLGQRTENINQIDKQLGSYHQCYRLDGRLIAMGVLDLLPNGVSSVYLMYRDRCLYSCAAEPSPGTMRISTIGTLARYQL